MFNFNFCNDLKVIFGFYSYPVGVEWKMTYKISSRRGKNGKVKLELQRKNRKTETELRSWKKTNWKLKCETGAELFMYHLHLIIDI